MKRIARRKDQRHRHLRIERRAPVDRPEAGQAADGALPVIRVHRHRLEPVYRHAHALAGNVSDQVGTFHSCHAVAPRSCLARSDQNIARSIPCNTRIAEDKSAKQGIVKTAAYLEPCVEAKLEEPPQGLHRAESKADTETQAIY